MGDSDLDDKVGMEYIKKHVIPLFHNQTDVSYYYFSWSATTRQKEQAETWTSVWAAQSWNGFLYPENNTKAVWQDIRENLSVMFRYCSYLSPKIELWGGEIANTPVNATAFPHRQAVYNVGVQLLVPNETTNNNASQVFQQQSALVGAVWPSIAKYLRGVYVNYPMPTLSESEYPHAYWGDNLPRLVDLKQQYDPFDVLHYEQSIPKKKKT
jgi:FAD/FMN-containing dehydrogenase